MIEENTIVGNTNGIFLAVGVQGNTIRRNVIVGNPSVQVQIDNPSTSGVDVKNLAADGANTFRDNICISSINAPCPAVERTSTPARPQAAKQHDKDK